MSTYDHIHVFIQRVFVITLFFIVVAFPKVVNATACSFPYIGTVGNHDTTLDACTATISNVNGTHYGIDDGQGGVLNDSDLILNGTSLTINNGGTLVAKSIVLSGGATISMQGTSARILPRLNLYAYDTDNDEWAASFETMATTSGTGKRLLYLMKSTSQVDCLDTGTNSNYVYNTLTCYQDADDDGYGPTTPSSLTCFGKVDENSVTCATATYAVFTGPTVLAVEGNAQISDYSNDCDDAHSTVYPGTTCYAQSCSVCATDGTCDALAAGEQSLAACQRCDGVSLTPIVSANNTQDTEGSNTCSSTCQRCVSGACGVQAITQDLWGHCTATGTVVRLYEAASNTCNAKCGNYTHTEDLCSGVTAACASHAGACIDVGVDASGTNNSAWIAVGGVCTGFAANCGTTPGGGTLTCSGNTTPWTNCRCQ